MPFNRFRRPDGSSVDTVLGPEMRSTGEVMGLDADFGRGLRKAQTAAFGSLPTAGRVFVSMANRDKRSMIFPIKVLADLGFEILATAGHRRGAAPQRGARDASCASTSTARARTASRRPSQLIQDGEIDLVINTPHGSSGAAARSASTATRSAPPRSAPTSRASPPSRASARPSRASRRSIRGDIGVRSLQDWAAGRGLSAADAVPERGT